MGSIVRDATQPKLASAQDIDVDAFGDEPIYDAKYPLDSASLEVEVTTGTSGSGHVFVTLYASNSDDMSDAIACGSIGPITGTNAAGTKFVTPVYVPARYVRAEFNAEGTLAGAVDVNLVPEKTGRVNAHFKAAANTGSTAGNE